MPKEQPPAATANASVIALAGVLIFFSLSLLYPAAAYPERGITASIAILLFLLISLAAGFRAIGGTLFSLPFALFGGWALAWFGSSLGRDWFFAGRADLAVTATSLLVFVVVQTAIAGERGDEQRISPRLATHWLAVVLAMEALFGLYQKYGPAGYPRTFATVEQEVLRSMPPSDPLAQGILYAVREGRASGTIGAPNIFASFCVFGVLAAIGCAFSARKAGARVAYAMAALTGVVAVVVSGSNGGVVALAGGLCVLAAIILARRLSPSNARLLFFASCAGVALIGVAVLGVTLLSPMQGSRWLGGSGIAQRFWYWRTAAGVWKDHPLFGAGAGGFEILYPQYRLSGSGETKLPHSWFFRSLAATGVVGMTFLLAGFIAVTVLAARLFARLREEPGEYNALAGVAAGCFALLFHGLAEYTFSFLEGSMLFFIGAGILCGAARLHESPLVFRRVPLPTRPVVYTLAGITAALLAVAIYFVQFVPGRGGLLREEAEALAGEASQPLLIVRGAYSRAINADPIDPRSWEGRGLVRMAHGDAQGLDDIRHAIGLNPYSARLHETLARALRQLGKRQEAIAAQKKAIALHPLDAGHRLTMAEMLLDTGDRKEAEEMWRSTLGLRRTSTQEDRRVEEIGKQLGVTNQVGNGSASP